MRRFTNEEFDYIKKLGLRTDFNNFSEDDWIEFGEAIGDQLVLHELIVEEDYKPTTNGYLCKDILSKLAED